MQLYFIRHGQSQNNLLWVQTGSSDGRDTDPDLTPVGRQQAEKAAQFLSRPGSKAVSAPHSYDVQNTGGFGITHIYCSLMLRAVITGTIIAQALDLPLVAWEDVHEGGGIYRHDQESDERIGLPGNNRAYFEAHYPDLILPDSLGEEGWWNRPFEEREFMLVRAQRFLHDLLEKHGGTDERVAVVSHGGFYNRVLRAILNLPDNRDRWFVINNAAITRIDFGDEIRFAYMNRVDFLPPELIT